MTTTLGQLSLPDKEIEQVFNSHDALSQTELKRIFEIIIKKLSQGIESIHLETFSLEQQLKREDYFIKDLEPLENAMHLMEPLIQVLTELSDIILNKSDIMEQEKILKIQSEYSSLQHFITFVKKQIITSNNEKELIHSIELLLVKIDDISLLIFEFQERKHASLFDIMENDQIVSNIDQSYELVIQSIEQVYNRISACIQQSTKLNRLFSKLKQKWDILQYEHDELKFEHKEDRWLAVFKRVADKVDSMIDALDRSVIQCYNLIQQTKSFIKSYKSIDKDQFKSIEKSFEAKYKYYTPSIDRMLTMLGNGISARVNRDNTTFIRHDNMIIRWNQLKQVMDELRLKDLIETERMISSTSSSSSTTIHSNSTDKWKSTLDTRSVRSLTPSSLSDRNSLGRSSPFRSRRKSSIDHSLLRGSISDSSSVGSPPLRKPTKTPRPTRNGSITTKKKEDFYDEDERNYGIDLMNTTRQRPSSVANIRSKTPNPPNSKRAHTIRSKSSMGDLMTNRSVTPSLIPRPKTPKEIPRPTNKPPPVPPIPKYIISHDSPLRKKQSMPALRTKMEISISEDAIYHPDPKDPLDIEVSQIVNASPISIQCQRAQPGRYYFGNELSMSSMGGKKMYACKLMTYKDRRGGQFKNNKVLIRVGGGWQDLEFFLLEHSSLMTSDVVVRSFRRCV